MQAEQSWMSREKLLSTIKHPKFQGSLSWLHGAGLTAAFMLTFFPPILILRITGQNSSIHSWVLNLSHFLCLPSIVWFSCLWTCGKKKESPFFRYGFIWLQRRVGQGKWKSHWTEISLKNETRFPLEHRKFSTSKARIRYFQGKAKED